MTDRSAHMATAAERALDGLLHTTILDALRWRDMMCDAAWYLTDEHHRHLLVQVELRSPTGGIEWGVACALPRHGTET